RVCRYAIAADILSERELETPITFIGLRFGFSQRGLAVAALDSNDYLPPMTGSSGRLQLHCFARRSICLIQFSRIKENPGQIALRDDRKRIELHRMTSLPLGLIEPSQVKNRSREQIVRRGICGRQLFGAF